MIPWRGWFCIWILVGGYAHCAESLRVDDALGVKAFAYRTPIALSPDGQLVAYTLQKPRRDNPLTEERFRYYTPTGASQESASNELWMADTRSGHDQNLTGSAGSSWGPVWSPDGQFLAFYSDRSGRAHLWIWERATGSMRQLSDAVVRPFWPFQVARWSPDGRTILTKLLPENLSLERAADLIVGTQTKTRGTEKIDDGPTVTVFSSIPEKRSAKESSQTAVESASWINNDLANLALIDIGTGNVRRISRSLKSRGYWFSPDGRSIAFTNVKGTVPNTQQVLYDLMILPLNAPQARVLVPDIRQDYGVSVSWSPDGSKLAYTMTGQAGQVDGFVVSVETGETHDVTPAPHPAFDARYGLPVWDDTGQALYLVADSSPSIGRQGSDAIWKVLLRDGSFTFLARAPGQEVLGIAGPVVGGRLWSPDSGRSLVLLTRDNTTKQEGFWKVELATGQASKLVEDDSRLVSPGVNFGMDVSRDGQTFVYVRQDARHPDDIWISRADFKNPRQLTHANPQLDNVAFGSSQLIEWRADAKLLKGGVILPANYEKGKRYPLVVFVYGGAIQSDYINQFGAWGGGFNLQILATRGYAILLPDTPVRKGTPMQDLLKIMMPGVDKAIELGIADPERLAVIGQSYGGYSTLALIAQTPRFKAAVDCDGPADLISYYGAMRPDGTAPGIGWAETAQGGMGGTPWQYRDRYTANSPIFFLDKVQTPLLIIQGELDPVVPPTQAEEVFVGLRRLGKEVVYAKYAGEEHLVGYHRLSNGVDMWNRVIAWFDQHLRPSQESPLKNGSQ